jgi:DNA repair protein RadC
MIKGQLNLFNDTIEEVKNTRISVTTFKLQLVKESSGKYNLESKKISSPSDCYYAIVEIFQPEAEAEEVLQMLTLDTKNKITGAFTISRGSLNSSIVHPREVFKRAILNNAASIIITHNHPSGDPQPSNEDISITKRLMECSKILGIDILDHIITGDRGYYKSLKEMGCL